MQKILNITHISLDGALCSILLRRKFADKSKYRLDIIPISVSRTTDLYMDALNKYSKEYNMIYFTCLTPPASLIKDLEGKRIIAFSRFANGLKSTANTFFTDKPDILTSDMLLRTICKGQLAKPMEHLVALTRDYELYQLKHRASMGLNYLFKGMYKFEEYIDRFENGYNGFSDEEKKVVLTKEAEVTGLKEAVKGAMWCGTIDKMRVSISPVYGYPNEVLKSVFDIEPLTDIAILLDMPRKYASVRATRTTVNQPLTTSLEVYLSTFISNNARAMNGNGYFTWNAKDETDAGIPKCFAGFLKWNSTLGANNFKPIMEVDV